MKVTLSFGEAHLELNSCPSTAKITKPLADETALAMPASFGESKGKIRLSLIAAERSKEYADPI